MKMSLRRGGAVTHADLEPSHRKTDLGSKTGLVLVSFTVLSGLGSFVLCLIAEATHTQVTWRLASYDNDHNNRQKYECVYSGSGQTPLLSGASAFLLVAAAMVVEHIYILIAVSKLPPPVDTGYWEHDLGSRAKRLTCQAAFFFITTWVCFAVGEILLLIGLSVESGHLTNWWRPRPNCLIVREGLFCAAGVFSLATVFLAVGLYVAALHIQRALHEKEIFRRQVLETSVLYASPPRSPQNRSIVAVSRESPVVREDSNVVVDPTLVLYYSSLVSSKMVS